jgi:hypothetical protein
LLLVVLMLWASCVVGAIGLTGYLVGLAAADLEARLAGRTRAAPSRPHWLVVASLLGFAVLMAACGVVLTGMVRWPPEPGGLEGVSAWAVLPWWSATAAATTALVLGRRRPSVR